MSSRRSVRARLVAFAVACLAVSQLGGSAEAQVVIKLGSIYPAGSPWETALKTLATKWQTLSGGQVQLKLYLAGTMGDEADIVQKLRTGGLQAAALSSDGLARLAPDARVLDIPLRATTTAQEQGLMASLAPSLVTTFGTAGYVLAGQWIDGTTHLFTTQAVDSIAAARAQKVFAMADDGPLITAYLALKLTVAPTDRFYDLVSTLAAGTVTAVFLPVRTASWLGVPGRAPYMLDLQWSMATAGLVIPKATWDLVPAALRPTLLTAVQDMAKSLTASAAKYEADALAKMKAAGLKVVTATDLAGWRAAVDAVAWQPGFVSKAIYDAMTAYLATH